MERQISLRSAAAVSLGFLLLLAATLAADSIPPPPPTPPLGAGVTEYATPTTQSGVSGLTSGPDGALWFTENDAGKIGRITTVGAITEYPLPNSGSRPRDIVTGPDGALWFVELSSTVSRVGRITTSGIITEYTIPNTTTQIWPSAIAVGPDGALWLTEPNADAIVRCTTAGSCTEYAVTAGSSPMKIVAGADGALWFAESGANKVGRITTSGSLSEYTLPPGDYSFFITAGPDSTLWIPRLGKVARITTTGSVIEYASPDTIPTGIAAGFSAMWVGSLNGKLVRITSTGLTSEYTLGVSPGSPTVGPDGAIWFTEFAKIGRFDPNFAVAVPVAGMGAMILLGTLLVIVATLGCRQRSAGARRPA